MSGQGNERLEMSMVTRNKVARIVTLMAALAMVGCGGSSGSSGGTTAAATTDDGRAVVTGSGAVVTNRAYELWSDSNEAFTAQEESGWTADSCSSVADSFEEASSAQDGGWAEALYMAGVAQSRCGEDDEARDMFNRALAIESTLCQALAGIAVQQMAAGELGAAMQSLNRALSTEKACAEAYANRAIVRVRQASSEMAEEATSEALSDLRRALVFDASYLDAFGQMALIHYNRALAENDRQRLDVAEVVCRQATLIDGTYAPIYNTWGLIKVERGEVIEALQMFQAATERDNSMFQAFMNFGQITQSFRGYQDARAAFARASELMPEDYDARIGLGAALRGLDQLEASQAEYERAVAIDAARPEAYFNLGLIWQDYQTGSPDDLNRARGYYEQFLERARAASNSGDFEDAIDNVVRECEQTNGRRRRRTRCMSGRLQNIQMTIEALAEVAELQAMAAEAEAQAAAAQEQMEAEAAAQQAAAAEAEASAPTDGGSDGESTEETQTEE